MGKRVGVKVTGFTETMAALKGAPPEVNKQLRASSFAIADEIAGGLRGWGGTAQAAPVLDHVRARNDRVPSMTVGGAGRAGVSGGASINQLLGANFGTSGRWSQFPPKTRPDYYVYRLIEHRKDWITRTWADAVNVALARIDPAVKRGA
jgi:hypothetical protein